MSRSSENTSREESELPAENYVYDFLYHDARRIASFLSQLGQFGSLSGVKHLQATAEDSGAKTTVGVNVGGPPIAGTSKSDEQSSSAKANEALEKTYDPLWINALDLFDKLSDHHLIVRNLAEAKYGQFVLFTGGLSLVDVGMMREAYKLPTFRALAGADDVPRVDHTKKRSDRESIADQVKKSPMKFGLELLSILPHGIQARFENEAGGVWCGLSADHMTGSASDLFLKHGYSIPGAWSVLGIFDARANDESPSIDDAAEYTEKFGAVAAMTAILSPLVRKMLGRPPGFSGLTPLMIFREVSP